MQQICDDLEAETAVLRNIVSGITEQSWDLPTPAEGWGSRDTVAHLGAGDWAAGLAAREPHSFLELKPQLVSGGSDLLSVCGADFESMTGAALWEWFETERTQMINAFLAHGPKDRIPWVGPDMSTLSFATARLMETWSHGSDIADTHGAPWPPTDRLRHIAHLGVTTRGWSYLNRGLEVPPGDVYVELTAPSGDTWTWGRDGAEAKVAGNAADFCLLVTQRRHRSEVQLQTQGTLAAEWLDIAQAYAGPSTDARLPRQ
jgi:uncharacterized protein (TIGR03084 family)